MWSESFGPTPPSRRERIATRVLQGFAAVDFSDGASATRAAVEWADLLIAELDKKEDEQ